MAEAVKTVRTYSLDGSTTDFDITFDYLARKFVQVTLIGVDRKLLVLNTDYRFATKTKISLTRAWGFADGYEQIEIRRYTSATDRLVDFTDGSILRAYDLNVSQVQTLQVAEEARDLTADTIGVNDDGNLDARGRKIVNLGTGTDPGDAVSYGQLQVFDNSALNSATRAKASENAAKASENAAALHKAAALVSEQNAKTSENNSKASENSAAASAEASATSAGQSLSHRDAAAASASTAAASASTAASEANRAKTEADRAAASNPANQLLISANLSDVASVEASRNNLNVYSKEETNGLATRFMGQVIPVASRNGIPGGYVPGDGQLVNRTGVYAGLWAEVVAGRVPVVDDSVWLADPKRRGAYSRGNGTTTFRLPDYNGIQSGSFGGPVIRGDGQLGNIGTMMQNAAPNVTGTISGYSILGKLDGQSATSAIQISRGIAVRYGPTEADTSWGSGIDLNISRANAAYGRDSTSEVRMNSTVMCFVISYAGIANNAGSIDALALSNRIEAVSTQLTQRQDSAWCTLTFDATTKAPSVIEGYGVASAQRTAGGIFLINFQPGIMKTANYGYSGSVTPGPVGSSAAAPHSIIHYSDGVKTTSAFEVHAVYASSGGAVGRFDPTFMSLTFKGGQV